MPLPEFKRTDVFQQVNDSIDLAKELSLELEARTRGLPSETDIHAAVQVMNHHLFGVKANTPALIKADEAYLNLPNDSMDLEFIADTDIQQARVEKAIMRGRVESFYWLGSTAISGFGVHLYGVELIAPRKQFSATAFVPVEAISMRLAS
jgi:hypothetical protein